MRIAGCGCSLVDFLYSRVDFSSSGFRKYLSRRPGDGGLTPGQLVFAAELEAFAGAPFEEILRDIVGKTQPDAANVGGPCMVPLIGAAQILEEAGCSVQYHGVRGDDPAGETIRRIVGQTPVDISHYAVRPGTSPFTDVFSDPNYDDGRGERTFVNNIGVAGGFLPSDLADCFFAADILLFGATALVPPIHDGLGDLLRKGKERGAINVVCTVFDFRNEKAHPHERWPLGASDKSYADIDLLIADRDEALRLSGTDDLHHAAEFFIENHVGAFALTHGPNPVHIYSSGDLFAPQEPIDMPVSDEVGRRMRDEPDHAGDTTGCGDNFVGGMVASMAAQIQRSARSGHLSLPQAAAVGVCAGGAACFHLGGTLIETSPGQKRHSLEELYLPYRRQVAEQFDLPEAML